MDEGRHPSSRRRFVAGSIVLVGATLLAGCDRLGSKPWFRKLLDRDEDANLYVQRLLLSDRKLAPEYTPAELSPMFKPNGTSDPSDAGYKALVKTGFQTFRLQVDGLVEEPLKLSLADLRAMPSRTQITRHDCVEGWSCIGQWTGVPLSAVLQRARLKPQARFIVFLCADSMDQGGLSGLDSDTDDDGSSTPTDGDAKASQPKDKKAEAGSIGNPAQKAEVGGADQTAKPSDAGPVDPGPRYYESIDLEDAFHPQTILAYEMNGQTLPVAHGAPLRLRVERQLGYKMAKYIMRIAVVDRLEAIGKGGGGYWEDNGYEWYAGI